jgi:mannose-1-phosphate guanylyltransferase
MNPDSTRVPAISDPAAHACAIIMAGGRGERFWPLSTSRRPKQLLALTGGAPLVRQAVDRLDGVVPPDRILVVTNTALVAPIREILGPDSPVSVLGEPVGRDTAAAIAAGAAWFRRRDPDALLCVLTADHLIGNLPAFSSTLRDAMALCASRDVLVTIGIPPAEPSTAFGYIESGPVAATVGGTEFRTALRFKEKPPREVAEQYLAQGGFFWNSGMFVWSLPSLLAAFRRHRPVLADRLEDWSAAPTDDAFQAALARDFPGLEKISVDFALMEHADNVLVCPARFTWDDIGSWTALDAHLPRDPAGNATLGDVLALDSSHNIVVSPGRLTALVGVEDIVVAQADGVTLVCHKSRAQDIKALLAALRARGGFESLL